MSQIISINLLLLAFISYYLFTKRRYRRLGYSPSNILIDRAYQNWYLLYNTYINKKEVTIYEIDKTILKLKNTLLKKGVTKDIVDDYIEMLGKVDKSQTLGFKDLIIAVLGYISANSWVNNQLNNIDVTYIINAITSNLNNEEFKSYILIIIQVASILLTVILFGIFLYIIPSIDSANKENQKLVLLKRLSTIWEFSINDEVKNLTELETFLEKTKLEDTNKIVFSKIEYSRSIINKRIDESIGNKVNLIFSFFSDLISNSRNKLVQLFSKAIKIIIGFALFFLTLLIIIVLNMLLLLIISLTNNLTLFTQVLIALFFLIVSILPFVFVFSIYNSQISVNVLEQADLSYKVADYQIVRITKRNWSGKIQGVIYLLVNIGIWCLLKNIVFKLNLFSCLLTLQLIVFSITTLAGYFFTVERLDEPE